MHFQQGGSVVKFGAGLNLEAQSHAQSAALLLHFAVSLPVLQSHHYKPLKLSPRPVAALAHGHAVCPELTWELPVSCHG